MSHDLLGQKIEALLRTPNTLATALRLRFSDFHFLKIAVICMEFFHICLDYALDLESFINDLNFLLIFLFYKAFKAFACHFYIFAYYRE